MPVLLNLDDELLKRIDDFRYESRIPSRSEAMRQLLLKGLESSAVAQKKSKEKK